MKLRTLESFKIELEEKLRAGHPGNIQIPIGDKLFLFYAESHDHEYDEEDNEVMTKLFLSMNYYEEHHDAVIYKEDDEFRISYTEGELSDKLFDLLEEEEIKEHLTVLWDAIDNWSL